MAIAHFVYSIVLHPIYSIGFILSFAAGFSFLIFLRGFLSGVGHIFTIDHHDDHQDHARVRAIWGVVLLYEIFMLWVLVRTVASFFGGPTINVTLTCWLFGVYAVLRVWGWFVLPPPPAGH